jgi:hypothetical protein
MKKIIHDGFRIEWNSSEIIASETGQPRNPLTTLFRLAYKSDRIGWVVTSGTVINAGSGSEVQKAELKAKAVYECFKIKTVIDDNRG